MFKVKRTVSRTPSLLPIDGAMLAWVVGGRITPRKGLDPVVAQKLTTLTQTISEAGQVMQAKEQQRQAQLQQVMQQLMQSGGSR